MVTEFFSSDNVAQHMPKFQKLDVKTKELAKLEFYASFIYIRLFKFYFYLRTQASKGYGLVLVSVYSLCVCVCVCVCVKSL